MLKLPPPRNQGEMMVELYGAVNRLHEALGELTAEVRKQNGRVARIERWQSYVGGAAALVMLIIGAIIGQLGRALVSGILPAGGP